jgi:hypothetical protein
MESGEIILAQRVIRLKIMALQFVLFLVLIFGVMGFGSNLFFRAIWLYCEWQEGNEIDWKRQIMLTLLVPGAYIFVFIEILAATGIIYIP